MKGKTFNFKDTGVIVQIEDDWLCVMDGETEILITPDNFKVVLDYLDRKHYKKQYKALQMFYMGAISGVSITFMLCILFFN
jgi:hypothetical protein